MGKIYTTICMHKLQELLLQCARKIRRCMPTSKGGLIHATLHVMHTKQIIQVQKIKGTSVIKPCPVESCAKDIKLSIFYYDDVKQNFTQ